MLRERRATTYGNALVTGLSALLAGALSGCGNSHLGGYFDGGRDADSGQKNDVRTDTSTPIPPPPPVGMGSTPLVLGEALLVGVGADSCSNQSPPTSDRWCAFSTPSNFLGNHDLWVINVTKVLAGKAVNCKGNDPNCLRLTSNLFDGDLTMHGFQGDTLLFYAENNGDSMNFIGTVFAWRPEWVVPRPLTSQAGLRCQAHPTALAALCIQNPVTDMMTQNFTLDIVGGKLGPDAGPLPVLSNILYAAPGDPANVTKFQIDFSPAGDAAIWSARTAPKGPEIVNWQLLDAPASRQVIAMDAAHWQVSADSKTWFWLKAFNYSTTGGDSGTLQSAPYPAGTPATTVAEGIAQYTRVGSKGMVVRAGLNQGVGELKLIGDIANVAGTSKTLDTGVLRVWDLAPDGTTALYSKTNSGQLVDMYLASVSKPAPCALSSTPLALGFGHLAENTLTAAWVKVTSQTDQGAFYTTFDQCMTRQFATNIVTFAAVSDQGYVYEDEGSDTAAEATLRFNQIVDGMLKPTGTVVQKRAYPTAALLWPAHAAVLYSINANGTTDGLYLNPTLPFKNLTPPPGFIPAPVDAGAGDATDGAADASAPDLVLVPTDAGVNDAASGG